MCCSTRFLAQNLTCIVQVAFAESLGVSSLDLRPNATPPQTMIDKYDVRNFIAAKTNKWLSQLMVRGVHFPAGPITGGPTTWFQVWQAMNFNLGTKVLTGVDDWNRTIYRYARSERRGCLAHQPTTSTVICKAQHHDARSTELGCIKNSMFVCQTQHC